MSDRRIEKAVLHQHVVETFQEASYIYVITYMGLTVEKITEFRGKLRDLDARCLVLKNTFIKLGLDELDVELPEDLELTGDTAVVLGGENSDLAAVAKIIKESGKENKIVEFKFGIVEGAFQEEAALKAIAELPPKEVILAELLGVIKAPAQRLVQTLTTSRSKMVWLLTNYQEKLNNE